MFKMKQPSNSGVTELSQIIHGRRMEMGGEGL